MTQQAATLENVIKYCTKIPTMTAVDVEEQVKLLTLDKLLIKKTQIGVKGSKKGSDQIIYCAPVNSLKLFFLNIASVLILHSFLLASL